MQRPVRFFEPSNSMTREKRVLEPNEAEEAQPEQKRHKVPALASVIVEALKVDSLQKLFSSLEPILRRVFIKRFSEKITAKNSKPVKVSEEVERALVKLGPTRLGGRSSPKRIEGPDGRNLQLHFRSGLSLPLFTGGRVEGQQGCAIHVVLLDANTGQFVTSGPESSAKLDVVVLEGDFNNEDDDDWAQEDFESHVVREREGKRPLLTGDLQVPLKEGVGTLGELTFTDNSSWIRSRKFRLGLKIAPGFCEGIRVREAKTDAFTVKDHRGELYKKHYPPALNDEVWRLEKIGKDGSFHKRLNKAGIYTVEEFLRLVVKDLQRLRTILGSGMSNKMWEVAVDHAKTCVLSGKLYVYYSDDTRNVGVVFNNIYELNGLIVGEQYQPAETLSESQKVSVDTLVKKAYDNWMHVVEYDGKALLNFKQSKKMNGPRTEVLMGPADYPAYDQQAPLHRMPLPVLPEQSAMDSGLAVGGGMASSGYDDNPATRYPAHVPHINSNMQVQFSNNASFAPQNQLGSSSSFSHHTQITRNEPMVGLALAPPQSTGLGFQSLAPPAHSSTPNPFEDWSRHRDSRGIEDFFSVDEIRMRSSEMLENDDMQNLLRIISMGGTSANVADETYPYNSYIPSPSPNYSFDEDRSRPSGKAVVGWLKLKAALRWGIFIRKIAAEKRAQLVELDDS